MRRFLVTIMGILFIALFKNTHANNLANCPGSEIGDAVFRPLGSWDILDKVEHTGMYRNSDGSKDWNPQVDMENSSWEYSVIQGSGEGKLLYWHDFETFKSGLRQKGKGFSSPKGKINTPNRKLLLQFARSQYGAVYPPFPDHWFWPEIMSPAGADPRWPNGSFRCDGIIEWSYDQIGMGSFSEEEQEDCYIQVMEIPHPPFWIILNLPTFYPAAMRRRMVSEEPIAPTVDIDYFMEFREIKVFADDGIYGSGIDWIGVYSNDVEWQNGPFNTFYPSKVNLLPNGENDDDSDDKKVLILTDVIPSPWTYRLIAVVADRAGNFGVDTLFLSLVVVSHEPARDEQKVDIYKYIQIEFSEPMDTASTRQALQIKNVDNEATIEMKEISWSNDTRTMLIRCLDPSIDNDTLGFDYFSNYRIRIAATASGQNGAMLDGNKNGKPEGSPVDDYSFNFKTRKPKASLNPRADATPVKKGKTKWKSIEILNEEPREVMYSLSDTVFNAINWWAPLIDYPPFSLEPEQIMSIPYSVHNIEALERCYHFFYLLFDTIDIDIAEHSFSPYVEKLPDHPDEGPIVDPQYPSPWYLNSKSEIGILLSGFYDGVGHLLGRYKINTCLLKPENMRVLGEPQRTIDSLSVLIIPSGGLSGLENFPHIKQALEHFVNHGGTIICFTQQYGYDMQLLPSAPHAFGWREDQSCWQGSGYFSDWDIFLSGQDSVIIDAHLDGFCIDVPTGSKIVMKRRISGMTELFHYPQGAGHILICGLYTDWAYGQSQWCLDEVTLVRDIVTWALDASQSISTHYAGEAIDLDIPVRYRQNEDTTLSNRAIVQVYMPDRDSLHTHEFVLSPPLSPGGYTFLTIENYTAPQFLGIYPITYSLYRDSLLLQDEMLGQRFAVRTDIPVGEYMLGDYSIVATTEAERVIRGDTLLFHLYLNNYTATPFTGKIIMGQSIGWFLVDSILNVDIPADSFTMFSWFRVMDQTSRFSFGLYEPADSVYHSHLLNAIARCERGVYVLAAEAEIAIETDKEIYVNNEYLTYSIDASGNFSDSCTLSVRIVNSNNECIDSIIQRIHFDSSLQWVDSTAIGSAWINGKYSIIASLHYRNLDIGNGTDNFHVRKGFLNCTLVPDPVISGLDTMSLSIQISPDSIIATNSQLSYTVVCPNHIIFDTLDIDTIRNNDTLAIPVEMSIDSMCPGDYHFKYELQSIDSLIGEYEFNNAILFGLYCLPPTMHWKDTLKLDFRLKNVGDFELPIWMIVEVEKPQGNFLDSALVNMGLLTDTMVVFRTEIDSGIPDDNYQIWTRIRSGKWTREHKRDFHVAVKLPQVLMSPDTTHYCGNDTATIILFNAGELEGEVRLTEVYLQDLQWNQFPLDTARFTIPPKDFAFYEFMVPEVMTAPYYLFVRGNEEGYNLPIDEQLYVWISGVEANITLSTSKDIYLPADSVLPQIGFVNGTHPFDGAMDLSIGPAGWYPGDTTFIAGDEYMWPIITSSARGCTLINNQLTLTGWDRLYQYNSWGITPGGKKDGIGGTAGADPVMTFLNAKRNKDRGDEPIRYAAVAAKDGDLYAAITTDIRRTIFGPYPNFHAFSFDLSSIASICQFALDGSYFYIADSDSGYIYKVSRSSGSIEKRWKASSPVGIGAHDGHLYVVDGLNRCIFKSTLNGDTVFTFGADSLSNPKDIAIDNSGNIFVPDLDKGKVYIFDTGGICTGIRATGIFSQIAIDEVGYLYGADLSNATMAKFDENGALIEHWGGVAPDDIVACDDIIHSATIYTTQWVDMVLGDVLKNYGRFEGYSKTKEYVSIPATFITDFLPTQNEQSGSVQWYFCFFAPVKDGPEEEWFPIETIGSLNLEEQGFPRFVAMLENPSAGTPPEVEKFDLHYVTRRYGSPIWQDSLELKYLPNDSLHFEKHAGVFADTGEFVFWGDIVLENGQHYPPPAMHQFSVRSSPLSLMLRTDRELYYPDEVIFATGTVVNNGDTAVSNLTLEVLKRDKSILDTLINLLEPDAACTVSTMLSDSAPFVLTGIVSNSSTDTLNTYKAVEIETPPLMFSTTFPCSTNHKPFETVTEITNWWTREVPVLLRTTCGDTQFFDSLVLFPEESKELPHAFKIYETETLFVELLYPFTTCKTNEIRFGEMIVVAVDSAVSAEPNPIIPYEAVNAGEFDCIFDLSLSITDTAGSTCDSAMFSHIIPIGDSLSGEWNPLLDYGTYVLNWEAYPESSTILLSEGSVPVTITKPNQVTIDSLALRPFCDSLGQSRITVYVSNHSANSFTGNIGLFSDFIYETKELHIGPLVRDTVHFLSSAILEEGRYGVTGKILQNGSPIYELSDSLAFVSFISIDSLPASVICSIGDSASVSVMTTSTGTATGERQLSFDFGEFGSETRDIALVPGEERTDSFFFYLPEDLEERTFYASIWLGNEEFVLPIQVLGYRISVLGHLNQPNFVPGDTVELTLDIENRNERILKGFCVANYNGEPTTQNFLLSGCALDIDLSDPELIQCTGDSGVYVSPIIWCGAFDSLFIQPEGTGNFDFACRSINSDTVHYAPWHPESALIGPSNGWQFRVTLFDPLSSLERVRITCFDSAASRDTTIETFSSPVLFETFQYPFDDATTMLFYGVYASSGRGLWLNTMYVFAANDTCNIVTDKQRYGMADTVSATVQSPFSGKLTWNVDFHPMGEVHDSLQIDSLSDRFQFAIPAELASGTYDIAFSLDIGGDTTQRFSSSHPFDVVGYQVSVFECRLDTNEYLPGDTMDVRFKLQSSHEIPAIAKLQFMQQYAWYEGMTCTITIDSGFNVIDLAVQVPELNRGIAFLNYSFHKDSMYLAHASEGFMVYLPDSIPPFAHFVEKPANTYNPHVSHVVKILAHDETRLLDTLFYHNGYLREGIPHNAQNGDTLIYEIPAQPRGTNIAYFVVVRDSFGNVTRLPDTDFEQLWVIGQLPPSACTTDTINQTISLLWKSPSEFLKHHSGFPYESAEDTFALRITPQFTPGILTEIEVYAQKSVPDTGILTLRFFSCEDGKPGNELCSPAEIKVSPSDPCWIRAPLDSIQIDGEIYLVLHGEGVTLFGDRNSYTYRTLKNEQGWAPDMTFGNLLAHARCFYEPESIFYRVLREDSMQYIIIADSVNETQFADSTVSGERLYRYLVKAHYMIPGLNATSPVLSQIFDYIPPLFSDSVMIMETDSTFLVRCEIKDGIGIASDSLFYSGTVAIHDSIAGDHYWYTIGKSSQQIPFYLMARDSAGNTSRHPDSGFFYTSPEIPEGFSGHISLDTTWTTDIIVNGDVWIDPGVTLAIEAGVQVLVVPHCDVQKAGMDTAMAEFIVQGNFDLRANDSMPVTFTSYALQQHAGDWYGIRFEYGGRKGFPIAGAKTNFKAHEPDRSSPREKESTPEEGLSRKLPENVVLNREVFERTKKVWARFGHQEGGSTHLANITVEFAQKGIVYQRPGFHVVQNATLRHNLECGIEIEEPLTWTIVENADIGLSRIGISGIAPLWIWAGSISDCDSAGVLYHGWNGFFYGTELLENTIGILSSGSSSPLIWSTTIISNKTGLYAKESSRPYLTEASITESDSIGVYIADNAQPNLGSRGHNCIHGSGSYDLFNNTSNTISAKHNYWGTMDLDTIQSHIYDFNDSESLGVVLIEPIWDGNHHLGGVMSEGQQEAPPKFELKAPAPNPFSSKTVITYAIPKSCRVSLKVYDISGKCIRILEDGIRQAGFHTATWDGRDNFGEKTPQGVYFLNLKSPGNSSLKKLILIR